MTIKKDRGKSSNAAVFLTNPSDERKPAEIAWEGDSKDVLSAFPHDVKVSLGFSLRQLQNGRKPRCKFRSMSSVGDGVWELKESDERTWYRIIYLSMIGNVLHVLHCFEKDSRKTDHRDIETAKFRLRRVEQRLREQRNRERISKES